MATREPSETEDKQTRRQRVRQATDALWRLNQYRFIACSCGVRLKIPPAFAASQIPCPKCKRVHEIPS